jgi:hypothetical protein
MKDRFRLYRRDKHAKGKEGIYYLEDTESGKRTHQEVFTLYSRPARW